MYEPVWYIAAPHSSYQHIELDNIEKWSVMRGNMQKQNIAYMQRSPGAFIFPNYRHIRGYASVRAAI